MDIFLNLRHQLRNTFHLKIFYIKALQPVCLEGVKPFIFGRTFEELILYLG